MKQINQFVQVLLALLLVVCAIPTRALAADEAWDKVEILADQRQPQAADKLVLEILARAQRVGDQEQWTRALIRHVRLQTDLGAVEMAVRELRSQPWPADPIWRGIVELYYAQLLDNYQWRYSYEIRGREAVASADSLDLKLWTNERFSREIGDAYWRVWRQREAWGERSLGVWSPFMVENNFPPRIRGTLRDVVSYLWAQQLADTANWSPGQSETVWTEVMVPVLAHNDQLLQQVDVSDSHVHPMLRAVAILDDLRDWHRAHHAEEAALETELAKVNFLHKVSPDMSTLADLRHYLTNVLEAFDQSYPWWSYGQLKLADLAMDAGRAQDAHAAATRGLRRHRDSIGGRGCVELVARIEQPALKLSAMSHDAAEKNSIRIIHQNLSKIYFRAWRLDWPAMVSNHHGRRISSEMYRQSVTKKLPDLVWTVGLPSVDDFQQHQSVTGLPACESGAYLVVASDRSDFKIMEGLSAAVQIIIGDLVVSAQKVGDQIEFLTRTAGTGEPRSGVKLTVFLDVLGMNNESDEVVTLLTNRQGLVIWSAPARTRYSVLATQGQDVAWLDGGVSWTGSKNAPVTRSFVYTDRPVYRPGQTLHWKIVGYQGNAAGDEFHTLPKRQLIVRLMGPGNQKALIDTVVTNDFGSAAGSFVIPENGLLGNWWLRDSLRGSRTIKVEEYKRPSFAVRLLDPDSPLKLGRRVVLKGQADYLFGAPVSHGEVEWRVYRQPEAVIGWRWQPPPPRHRVLATGTAHLDSLGQFSLGFAVSADDRVGYDDPVIYRFLVEADVTGDGGETRSVERVFRVSRAALLATISSDVSFVRDSEAIVLQVRRTDLNDVPQAGEGHWTLFALAPPEPEEPWKDNIPPRWSGYRADSAVLRDWTQGREVASGDVRHGLDGLAAVELDHLPSGPLRLVYTTTDRDGQAVVATHEFLSLGAEPLRLGLPLVLKLQNPNPAVGDTAYFLLHSGLPEQQMYVQIWLGGERVSARYMRAGRAPDVLAIPVPPSARQGLAVVVDLVRDHRYFRVEEDATVPWDNTQLEVTVDRFRDRLVPGSDEEFTVTVKNRDGSPLDAKATELLGYMYDRSLDAIARQGVPANLVRFGRRRSPPGGRACLGVSALVWRHCDRTTGGRGGIGLSPDRLFVRPANHTLGGRMLKGATGMISATSSMDVQSTVPPPLPPAVHSFADEPADGVFPVRSRRNFAETAFWLPHVQLAADGTAVISFQVPDAVTGWHVWLSAVTNQMHSGVAHVTAASVQDLMVRPYLPRYLREGDRADLRVVVNNTSAAALRGDVNLELLDPATGADISAAFGLSNDVMPFLAAAGSAADLGFQLTAPPGLGAVQVRVVARAGNLSDGEVHLLPLLPGRMHLAQSHFVVLHGVESQQMSFPELADTSDVSRQQEQLVVTVNAQLLGSVLRALPYLVEYPYRCTEQTLNRFLSTSIVATAFADYPAVKAMAEAVPGRTTPTQPWRADDPNRRLLREESPWYHVAGGSSTDLPLTNILAPAVVAAQREASLARLAELQNADGGFPWFPGGPSQSYMTWIVLSGFARGAEFGVVVPPAVVRKAWSYLHLTYRADSADRQAQSILLNYLLSSYPEAVWQAVGFTADDRHRLLDESFASWREQSRLLRGYLALALHRAGRAADAALVFASVMDAAQTDPTWGTYWAPEDRAWLWYNDTVESHAFALRVLTELAPDDPRNAGLAQWLLLNKKLNHWSSTRATAEVIYALTHYMAVNGQLDVPDVIDVACGSHNEHFDFATATGDGGVRQIAYAGDQIDPATMSTVMVSKKTPGLAFASATWHYSTEELPNAADGSLFGMRRQYYRRKVVGERWTLTPMAPGDSVSVGDQIEVQLAVTAHHPAEYVHLRAPRAAGCEPVAQTSGYRWQNGVGYYEEVRDSGVNFFCQWLPQGQFVLKYRLRVNMAGTFRVMPATIQSLYAPEFAAHSAGRILNVAR